MQAAFGRPRDVMDMTALVVFTDVRGFTNWSATNGVLPISTGSTERFLRVPAIAETAPRIIT
jgi:hypothetical protein